MNICVRKNCQDEEATKRLSEDVYVCACACVRVCVFYRRWQEKASLIKCHLRRDLKEMKE